MTRASGPDRARPSRARTAARLLLGSALVFAGSTHLTVAREEFRAQVPPWLPLDPDDVVLMSGVVEIGLGTMLIALPKEQRRVGLLAAAFFTAIFPGNIAQWREKRDGFGLDTDTKRFARLFFQPVLIIGSLWATGSLRGSRRTK
ncbi:MAG: hypothetical protein ABWZ77_02225 [Naasia sp.]